MLCVRVLGILYLMAMIDGVHSGLGLFEGNCFVYYPNSDIVESHDDFDTVTDNRQCLDRCINYGQLYQSDCTGWYTFDFSGMGFYCKIYKVDLITIVDSTYDVYQRENCPTTVTTSGVCFKPIQQRSSPNGIDEAATTEQTCKEACQAISDCAGVAFNSDTNKCTRYDESNLQIRNVANDQNTVQYWREECPPTTTTTTVSTTTSVTTKDIPTTTTTVSNQTVSAAPGPAKFIRKNNFKPAHLVVPGLYGLLACVAIIVLYCRSVSARRGEDHETGGNRENRERPSPRTTDDEENPEEPGPSNRRQSHRRQSQSRRSSRRPSVSPKRHTPAQS